MVPIRCGYKAIAFYLEPGLGLRARCASHDLSEFDVPITFDEFLVLLTLQE